MLRATVLLAMALAACAGAPGGGAASSAPVATVLLASPPPPPPAPSAIADAASPDAPAEAASTDASAAPVGARPVARGCDAQSMDLPTVQRACACPRQLELLLDAGAAGPRCLPLDTADQQRILRDVTVQVGAPASMAAGARIDLDVSLRNGGAEPVPLLFVDDEPPEIVLSDAQGRRITATVDPSCTPMGMLRMAPVSLAVVPPGGVVRAAVPFQAVRWRSVGSAWRSPAKPSAGRKRSVLEEQIAALAAQSDEPCRDVPDGPLPRGDYTVEVRLPLMPQDLSSKVVGRASIRVR